MIHPVGTRLSVLLIASISIAQTVQDACLRAVRPGGFRLVLQFDRHGDDLLFSVSCHARHLSVFIGQTSLNESGGFMPDKFVMQTRFVDLPGVRIACDIAGEGAAVVFLHGGLLDRRMWDGQFEHFAGRLCAIRYDLRSSGESETMPRTEAFSHHEDLFDLLKLLDVHRVSLIGHSNHAIALDFALAYPSLVDKLVLVSPGLRGYDFRDPWIGTNFAAMMRALGQRDLNGAVEVFLTMWVDGPLRRPAEVDPLVRERACEMATRAFQLSRLAPNCKGMEPPAAGRLDEIDVPTMVVLGDKDAPDIHAIGQLIREAVPGSRLVRIPNVGHALMMEKPAEFNKVVEEFLLT